MLRTSFSRRCALRLLLRPMALLRLPSQKVFSTGFRRLAIHRPRSYNRWKREREAPPPPPPPPSTMRRKQRWKRKRHRSHVRRISCGCNGRKRYSEGCTSRRRYRMHFYSRISAFLLLLLFSPSFRTRQRRIFLLCLLRWDWICCMPSRGIYTISSIRSTCRTASPYRTKRTYATPKALSKREEEEEEDEGAERTNRCGSAAAAWKERRRGRRRGRVGPSLLPFPLPRHPFRFLLCWLPLLRCWRHTPPLIRPHGKREK